MVVLFIATTANYTKEGSVEKANDKKPIYKKWWFWVLVVIIVAAIGSGMSKNDSGTKVNEQKTNQPTQTSFKVGDTIAFDNKKVTVSSIQRNWDSGNQFIRPASGKEYIKVQVTIENNSSNEVAYNSFDWKLQDSSGVIKDIDANTFTVDGGLNSGNLAPNGKVSGFMVFEVPAGDAGLTLRYSPSFWNDKKLEIKL